MAQVYHIFIDSRALKKFRGLNELLDGKVYNARAKRYFNPVKTTNDDICLAGIKRCIRGIRFEYPIRCHYRIYLTNRKHDRGNIYAAVEKSFLDALQKARCIKNDGWNDVLDSTFYTAIDKDNPRIEVDIEVFNRGIPDEYRENQ